MRSLSTLAGGWTPRPQNSVGRRYGWPRTLPPTTLPVPLETPPPLTFAPRPHAPQAGCSYEYDVVGGKAFAEVKPTLQFGRLPVLYDYDGKGSDLVQSHAITRFIARKLGLAGQTPEEMAAVDMVYCQFQDTLQVDRVSCCVLCSGPHGLRLGKS